MSGLSNALGARRPIRRLVAAALALAFAAPAFGTTYYVRKTGNDGNAGTSAAAAWLTIGEAASNMSAGDEVYIGAGTYSESILPSSNGTSGNPIRYIGDVDGAMTGDAGDVIVEKSGSVVFNLKDKKFIHLIGLHVRGGTFNIDLEAHDSGLVERCVVYDATTSYGINLKKSMGTTMIINCLVRDNATNGIWVEDPAGADVWHCTIVDNGADGIHMKKGTATVTNCIIANNGAYGIDREDGTITHTYNLIWGNTSGEYNNTSAGTGEQSFDPLFISATDFHLDTGSPAEDNGTDGSSATSEDLDENSRPIGSGWDMGCYEKDASGALPRIVSWQEVQPGN